MRLAARVRALVAHRRILWLLIRRDLKVRYAGSVLGYVWTVLDPLMMILVYWFIFTIVFPRRGNAEDPFILFLAFGQLAWQWFNGTVNESTRALTSETRLVRSTRLPREIWVLKVVGSKGLEYVFSLPVVLAIMVLYRKVPSWEHVLLFPVAMVLQAVLLTGIALTLAAATVLVRDLARVVRIVLRIAFYATPILYSASRLDSRPELQKLILLNPFAGIVDLYRSVAFPDQMAGTWAVVSSVVLSFAFLLLGAWVFARLEGSVLKEL